MHARTKSKRARRPIGQRVAALVTAGSLVSACAPITPSPTAYPYAGRPMWSGGYRTATAPYAYQRPVASAYPAPSFQQEHASSNIENDALFGGAGYLAGRQFSQNAAEITATGVGEAETAALRGGVAVAADETVAAGAGATETAAVARTVTVTVGRAAATELGAGAVAAEGGEVAAAAAVGEFLVPALLIGGAAYLAYRAWSDSSQHDH